MSNIVHQSEFSIPMQLTPRIRINAVYELTARVQHVENQRTLIFAVNDKRKERAREDIERALNNVRSLHHFNNTPLTEDRISLKGVCEMAKLFGICTENVLMRDELTNLLKARIGTECSICQDEFESDQFLLKTNCNHCFHSECIEKWTEMQLNNNLSVEMGNVSFVHQTS